MSFRLLTALKRPPTVATPGTPTLSPMRDTVLGGESAPMPAPAESELLMTCLNCHAPNVEAFCPRCGQERGGNVAPIREMALDAAGEFLHWDSKLFATLKGFLKPGFLTVQYLAGRRASFITPLRLYLWVSALYFLIFSATVQKEVEQKFAPEAFGKEISAQRQMEQGAARGAALARIVAPREDAAKKTAAALDTKGKDVQAALDMTRNGVIGVITNMATVMLVVLLVEAALLYLLYRRRQPLFAPHLVTIIHVNAALLFVTCPLLFWRDGHGYHNLVTLPIQPIYYFLALRRLYGGVNGETWKKTLAKTVLFFLMLGFIAATVLLGGGVVLGIWLASKAK